MEICADPEIARWTNVPSPYTLEDARAWIALAAVERRRGTALHLLATRADDVVGSAALRLHGGGEPYGDAGYYVAPEARGQGNARRALALVTALGIEFHSLPYIEVAVAPANEASMRVPRAAGYTEDRRELREFKSRLMEFTIWRHPSALAKWQRSSPS